MTRRNPGIALRGDRNECPSCARLFNSTRAFDKHRTGTPGTDRRCRTEAEMLAAGMVRGADAFWRSEKSRENAPWRVDQDAWKPRSDEKGTRTRPGAPNGHPSHPEGGS